MGMNLADLKAALDYLTSKSSFMSWHVEHISYDVLACG